MPKTAQHWKHHMREPMWHKKILLRKKFVALSTFITEQERVKRKSWDKHSLQEVSKTQTEW